MYKLAPSHLCKLSAENLVKSQVHLFMKEEIFCKRVDDGGGEVAPLVASWSSLMHFCVRSCSKTDFP